MTVNPDEGMQLLTQRMSASRHIAEAEAAPMERDTTPAGDFGGDQAAAADGGGPGLELGAVVGLMTRATTALERHTAAMTRGRSTGWEHIHPVEIPPGPQTGKNIPQGTPPGVTFFYDEPDLWGPADGWAWRINGWTLVLGTGATLWQVWYESPADPTNLVFSSNASGRWEPDRFYLMPGRRVVFTSNGGPLTVCKGIGEEIAIAFLPHYLAGSVARFV